MIHREKGNPDQLTVLIFKDNLAARTFQIPLRWVSRFAILLWFLVLLTGASIVIALKYYRIGAKADLTHVQDLEQEVADLKASLKGAEAKSADLASRLAPTNIGTPSVQTAIPAEASRQKSVIADFPIIAPTPATTPAVAQLVNVAAGSANTQPLSPLAIAPVVTGIPKVGEGAFNYFAFPIAMDINVPDPSTLPFTIQAPKVRWRGKRLFVDFALQYTKNDDGNQQGRILVLARGPQTLLGYPAGVFNGTGAANLIAPEKGEFFSVSRFREVKAEFPSVKSNNDLKEIEILIINRDTQPLFYKRISVPKPSQSEPESENEP